MRNKTRGGDVVCRFGGEEFVLLLADCSLAVGLRKAEALRASLAGLDLQEADVTASIGLAEWSAAEPIPYETLFKRADEAVYLAKEGGRNITVAWDAGPLDEPARPADGRA